MLKKDSLVLFQGDSITDTNRHYEDGSNMGYGYPNMISARFSALYPELNVRFINRGISGNRAIDMKNRWQKDCIDLQPDYLSILIGINDCWRRYDGNDPTSAQAFKQTYHEILTDAKNKTNAKLILCEPFVLPYPSDRKKWREDLDLKITAVRELAMEFNALLIPFDGLFAQASCKKGPAFWTEDGVHPTQTGHALIAEIWINAVENI
jgi:acyl-CoA thioesterase-1